MKRIILLILSLTLMIGVGKCQVPIVRKKKEKTEKIQSVSSESSRQNVQRNKNIHKKSKKSWKNKYKSVEHYVRDYYIVNDGQKYGICKDGTIVLPCLYDEIKKPNYNTGWNIHVRKGNKWGVLCGEEPIYSGFGREEQQYEKIKHGLIKRSEVFATIISCNKDSIIYSNDLITFYVLKNKKYAQLTGSSITLQLSEDFDFTTETPELTINMGENGVAIKDNGKWGYVGYFGNIPFEYSYIVCLHEGFMTIWKEEEGMGITRGIASFDGSILIPLGKYKDLYPYNEDCITAKLIDGKEEGIINIKDEILLPFEYDYIDVHGNMAICEIGNKFGLINWKTKKIIEPFKYNYEDLKWEPNGNRCVVTNNGLTYIVDQHGNRE